MNNKEPRRISFIDKFTVLDLLEARIKELDNGMSYGQSQESYNKQEIQLQEVKDIVTLIENKFK